MGHVQVPAVHHRLFGVQFQEVFPQVVLPRHPVVQPCQLVLGIGRVAAHQKEILVLRRDDPSLMPVDILAKVVCHRQRLPSGENSRAGISGLVGAVPESVIALQLKLRLLRPHLRLLQTDDIRVRKGAEGQETFIQTGPQPVHIP